MTNYSFTLISALEMSIYPSQSFIKRDDREEKRNLYCNHNMVKYSECAVILIWNMIQ